MPFTVAEACFSSEEQAISEIEARGWHPIAFDVPAEAVDWHWHDFDAVLYVVSGSIVVEPQDGRALTCGAWSRLEAPANTVHREATAGYRAVFGLSVEATQLSQPINKLVAQPA